jgi:DNA mismatch repair ATPase MutS
MDALALAIGTVEYLMSQPRTLVLFSTHLHTLMDTIRLDPRAKLLEFGGASLDDLDNDDDEAADSNERRHALRSGGSSDSRGGSDGKSSGVGSNSNAMSLAARCGMPGIVVEEAIAMREAVVGNAAQAPSKNTESVP